MRNGATREGFVRIRLPVFCSSPQALLSTALNLHPSERRELFIFWFLYYQRHARCFISLPLNQFVE
jgi:hypothetical protein